MSTRQIGKGCANISGFIGWSGSLFMLSRVESQWDVMHRFTSVAVFLFGAVALVVPTGYSLGPVLLLLTSLMLVVRRSPRVLTASDRWVVGVLLLYGSVVGGLSLWDLGSRGFDRPVRLAWLDAAAARRHGARTYFNHNIRLEATNVCVASCLFCSFARLKEGMPGAHTMSVAQIVDLGVDAVGAVQKRIGARFAGTQGIRVLTDADWQNLAPASLDMIIVVSVVQYLSRGDLEFLMDRLRTLLKPDGEIIFVYPVGANPKGFEAGCPRIVVEVDVTSTSTKLRGMNRHESKAAKFPRRLTSSSDPPAM